ncbi:L-rhamnose mutarotase [Streptomyces sp. NPDC054796]
MRIGELSRRTGVAIPTIKFYVREGLLPPGELTSPNQARYGEEHERRLRLVRALIEVGGLSVAAVGEVLSAVTSPDRPVHDVLGVAQYSVTAAPEGDGEGRAEAERAVQRLSERRGWPAEAAESPATATLIDTLTVLEQLGHGGLWGLLDTYAEASELIAEADVSYVADAQDAEAAPEVMAERLVVGTVLGDTVLMALRRLAQEAGSARRFEDGGPDHEKTAPASAPAPASASEAGPGVQRYGKVIRLRPEHAEEYLRLHAQPWPAVLEAITACNIRNYSIFLDDGLLFSYFEYVGDDYAADTARMAADPVTRDWWKLTDPCQEQTANAVPGEWWTPMREVFHHD